MVGFFLIICVVIVLILFFWAKISSIAPSDHDLQNSDAYPETLSQVLTAQTENSYKIDLSLLSTLPDRTQAISFHKATLLKSFENEDFDQANLSFAKLLETYRQLAIRNDESFLEEKNLLWSLYDSFRDNFNLSIPKEFLPPTERAKKPCESSTLNVTKLRKFLKIDQLDFFGPYKESPNKKFTLAWSDSNQVSVTTDKKEFVKGTYILLDGDKIIAKGRLAKPARGAVGDNGNFILIDRGFGKDIEETFCAFSPTGTRILKKIFKTYILNFAISDDGGYAICQAGNSSNKHHNLLSFFDLSEGVVVWSQRNEWFFANSYRFATESRILFLSSADYTEFAWSFNGAFLDAERFEIEKEKKAYPYELVEMAKEALKLFLSGPEAKKAEYRTRIFDLTNRLINIDKRSFPTEKSYGLRIQGEVFEHEKAINEAIERYEEALRFDAKVGVKRRLSALKKKNQ